METNFDLNPDKDNLQSQIDATKSSVPTIVGIILIIAGVLAIVNWLSFFFVDESTLGIVMEQFRQANPDITSDQVISLLTTCGVIGCIVSIFPILGGILCFKRKMWGIALACSIIGLFSIGVLFASSFLSLIAIIILFISKKNFNNKSINIKN